MFENDQNKVLEFLEKNEAEKAVDYIISFLNEDKKDYNRKIFGLHELSFIAGNYKLPMIENTFTNKAIAKAKKLLICLKKIDITEIASSLLCCEATLENAIYKNKIRSGVNHFEAIKLHIQKTITNYRQALCISVNDDETYNQINNIGNSLALTGRFVEALDLLQINYETDPNRYQSFASWSTTAEALKHYSILPDLISYDCVIAENYMKAIKLDADEIKKDEIKTDILRFEKSLSEDGIELSEELLEQNRVEERNEFEGFSEYRQFVLTAKLSLNEHALHCFCKNAEKDNLNIGYYFGSRHVLNNDNLGTIERAFSRIKSEFSFARLLYYKYLELDKGINPSSINYYIESDLADLKSIENSDHEPFEYEHLRTAYRLSYSILDKIAQILLLLYNIDPMNQHYYFEDVFSQFSQLTENDNQHLYALYSISLDLSREQTDSKGALKKFKDIRNKFEHDILFIHEEPSDIENGEINKDEFIQYLQDLLKLTRAAIFSATFLVRIETIVEKND